MLEENVSHRRTPQVTQLFNYLLTHNLLSSCIRRYLVSRACDWVMPALCAFFTYFQFPIQSAFFNISLARPHQHCGVLLVLIRNIGYRTLPKRLSRYLFVRRSLSLGRFTLLASSGDKNVCRRPRRCCVRWHRIRCGTEGSGDADVHW